MSDTFLKNCRITNVVSEKMIIAKIFRFMHVVLKKNLLHVVHTQKAHFETHKYGVLISKKIKISAKFTFCGFVPVVCTSYSIFCEKTKVL